MSDQYPPPGSYPPPGGGGGYPPPGGNDPYGQQQPSSGAPYGPPASGAPFGAPPPPPKKSNAGKIILIVVGIILVLALVCCGGIFLFAKDTWNDIVDSVESNSANAKVGDCLAGDTITEAGSKSVSVKIVACDAADAKYKVIGIKSGVPQSEALKSEPTVCDAYAEANYVLWQGPNPSSGDALCLADAK
ncbi:hypothetical protein Drose_33515 [Dactylosporangium roseum]|uniref:Uncharacterized protein n=1 Tax=Dactylosporangium roseum TaxID=47989 RepID=A0ABY5Z1Q1_9ACTN|nr:hypothetical protein [Dactylosporangium roseum]UWZ35951.1 hypothetical protein Drose_33515 [Dactylosporangium roseum]